VAEATGVTLPEHEDYRTLSGLVLKSLGRVAVPGDTVTVALPSTVDGSAGEVRLRVESVRRHVPDAVSIMDGGGPR
jgi:CBS domain containing-hemolysin-like protein